MTPPAFKNLDTLLIDCKQILLKREQIWLKIEQI